MNFGRLIFHFTTIILGQTPASDSVRPEVKEVDDSKPRTEGKLTDAPLEDEVLHGDGEAGDDGDER